MPVVAEDVQPKARGHLQSPETTDQEQVEIRVRGKTVYVPSVQVNGRNVINIGKWIRIATVQDEDLVEGDTVTDPSAFISSLKQTALRFDLFTFGQRPPDAEPKYDYHVEWDNAAVLPITTFSHWWQHCTEYSVRKAVNRAKKLGVLVKQVDFDDHLAEAIYRIYSETPVRQGKAFWHYEKDLKSVKHELATYLDRSVFIGAYCEGQLIGSLKMTYVGVTATIMQIFSARKHFDKRPNNALIAKAIEVCERESKQYLIYGSFVYHDPDSSLTEFKRRNGFVPMPLPKYYIPLTRKGRLALRLGLHRGVAGNMPKPILKQLLRIRSLWYAIRLQAMERSA